uniref:Uncharacterized protein n=1 Tax=Euplotes harpa TaxID=151035 RepID=A0A7S3J288_9SPIT|mmetsp:Transcript_13059/g.15058  ORF Transcript_13059/g.15058 Transcript_13059/m.15058 type:complete len:158 (+) Transcript_13059:604-1077(+)
MAKYDEDTLITGCDDGYVRAISLLPNKVISVINSDIDAEDCLPISKVAVKGDLLAYVATDEIVRIYDVSSLGTRVVEEYEEPPEREEREEARDEELEEDKDWEEIEGQFDSEGEEDEEEEEEEVARAQMEVEDRGIKWDGNKGNMERKKRENFFKDL